MDTCRGNTLTDNFEGIGSGVDHAYSDYFEGTPSQEAVLYEAMSALLADLQSKGLPAQTQVVLATEFGHTPRINDNDGRDHHDTVFTCLLAGAGIKSERADQEMCGWGAVVESTIDFDSLGAALHWSPERPAAEAQGSNEKRWPLTQD